MVRTPASIEKARLARLEKLTGDRKDDGLTRAIQAGEVDAVVVLQKGGPRVYRINSDEPLYRTIVEEMAHGVGTVLDDGTVVYANRHLLTMVGQSAGHFVGSSILPCISASDQPLFTAMLHRALITPQELEVSFRWATGEGPVLVSARKLSIDGLDAIGLALVDLREQRARRAAEESNKAKDELLASVSHELRTPLSSMMGWVQLLEWEFGEDPRVSQTLHNLKAAVAAEARIVDDLLDLSRSERAALLVVLQHLDLRDAIETAVSFVRLQAENKSVALNVQLPEHAVPVLGDSDRLRQVFVNLLTNALKFTEARGAVEVRVTRCEEHVEVAVTDTGIGISKDFLPFVFEPFRRGDGVRNYQGLGIGLAIARRLAEAHGGSISAESDGIGHGARFIFRLPVNGTDQKRADSSG